MMLPILVALLLGVADVSVTTKDGRVIEGTTEIASFNMRTDFGSATINAQKVAQIQFGEPDVVVTTGDVELRGRLVLDTLVVQTEAGAQHLARGNIQLLVLLDDGVPRGIADFSGRWLGTFGPLELEQVGITVKGTYGFDNESEIEGQVKGRKLSFKCRHANGSGEGWFELWEDGRIFMGELASAPTRSWGAYKIEWTLAAPHAGEVTEGQSKSYLNYHLRVPKTYDGEKRFPAIAFFHGSNMSSRPYVQTIAQLWPKLADDYILVGFEGEQISPASRPGQVVYNASYVNFSGHEVGPKWVHRQTPALVADALDELRAALPITHFFIGGHSQGGFLTYAIHMFYPEKIAGSFAMSCNLLVQCEPDSFDDEDIRKAQRAAPLAVVHGQQDKVVDFSGGEYVYQRMVDGGFSALRFFAPSNVGHAFNQLPVEQAVRWLEAMASRDPEILAAFGEERLEAGEHRDAMAAVMRAGGCDGAGSVEARLKVIADQIDAKARATAETLEEAIQQNLNGSWVEEFVEFRREFAFAPAAADCMRAYERLREAHQKGADELFYAARSEQDAKARQRMYGELVDKYYASKWYMLVKDWVE